MYDSEARRRIAAIEKKLESLSALANFEAMPPLVCEQIAGIGTTVSLDETLLASDDPVFDVPIRIVTGTMEGIFYDALTESRDDGVWTDQTPVWALDLAGSASLLADDEYLAMIARDGNGTPVAEPGGPTYVSIIAANIGNALTDPASWLATATDPTAPPAWDHTVAYVAGDLVTSSSDTFICILDNTDNAPPNATYWLLVVLADQGGYSGGNSYGVGDYVQEVRPVYAIRSDAASSSGGTPGGYQDFTAGGTFTTWITPATTTQTWTCPDGVTSVVVQCIGMGAPSLLQSVLSTVWMLGGSGGGAYASKTVTVVPGTTYTITFITGDAGYVDFNGGQVRAANGKAAVPWLFSSGAGTASGGAGGAVLDSIGTIRLPGGDGGDSIWDGTNQPMCGGGGGSAGPYSSGYKGEVGSYGKMARGGWGFGRGGDSDTINGIAPLPSTPGGGSGGISRDAIGGGSNIISGNGGHAMCKLTWEPGVASIAIPLWTPPVSSTPNFASVARSVFLTSGFGIKIQSPILSHDAILILPAQIFQSLGPNGIPAYNVGSIGTTETDLLSVTLPGTLFLQSYYGDRVKAEYGFKLKNSSGTATRQIKVKFGAAGSQTTLFDSGALSVTADTFAVLRVTILAGHPASVQLFRYMITLDTQAAVPVTPVVGELTGLISGDETVLTVTGTAAGVGAADDDIQLVLATGDFSAGAF